MNANPVCAIRDWHGWFRRRRIPSLAARGLVRGCAVDVSVIRKCLQTLTVEAELHREASWVRLRVGQELVNAGASAAWMATARINKEAWINRIRGGSHVGGDVKGIVYKLSPGEKRNITVVAQPVHQFPKMDTVHDFLPFHHIL